MLQTEYEMQFAVVTFFFIFFHNFSSEILLHFGSSYQFSKDISLKTKAESLNLLQFKNPITPK